MARFTGLDGIQDTGRRMGGNGIQDTGREIMERDGNGIQDAGRKIGMGWVTEAGRGMGRDGNGKQDAGRNWVGHRIQEEGGVGMEYMYNVQCFVLDQNTRNIIMIRI